jgi:predicted histidine transporter YuiF (NhaC family)
MATNACAIAIPAVIGGGIGAFGAAAFTTATAGAGFVFGAVHQNVFARVEPLLMQHIAGIDVRNFNIATPEGAHRYMQALQNIDQVTQLVIRLLSHLVATLAGAAAVTLLGMAITFEVAATLALVMIIASIAIPILLQLCCLCCCADRIGGMGQGELVMPRGGRAPETYPEMDFEPLRQALNELEES